MPGQYPVPIPAVTRCVPGRQENTIMITIQLTEDEATVLLYSTEFRPLCTDHREDSIYQAAMDKLRAGMAASELPGGTTGDRDAS
jgi:hypothetical protein